jgi:hypothetical protein
LHKYFVYSLKEPGGKESSMGMLLNFIRCIYRRKARKFGKATKGIISERERRLLMKELEREAYQNTLVTTVAVVRILSKIVDIIAGAGIMMSLILGSGIQNIDGTINIFAGLADIVSLLLVVVLINKIKPYLKDQELQIKKWIDA